MATASAQGRDYSNYQHPLTPADLHSLDFCFTKATNGLTEIDPNLAHNWATLAAWGKVRGAYHEMTPVGTAAAQAGYFVAALKNHGGLRPGDVLSVVASDYPGLTDTAVKACCDQIRTLVGPQHPILAYTDLSTAKTLVTTSEHYELWVAWPNATAPGPAQWAPAKWKTWRIWQWGLSGGVDANAHQGTAADLNAWIAGYTKPPHSPPAPAPAPGPTITEWVTAGQCTLNALCTGTFHCGVSTVLRYTAEKSPAGQYTPAMAAYLNTVLAADHKDVPSGTVVWHPSGAGDIPFTSHGTQTLQGLANSWKCQPSAIVRCTAERSPGAVFSAAFANHLNSVFAGSALKVPAGITLYYSK